MRQVASAKADVLSDRGCNCTRPHPSLFTSRKPSHIFTGSQRHMGLNLGIGSRLKVQAKIPSSYLFYDLESDHIACSQTECDRALSFMSPS